MGRLRECLKGGQTAREILGFTNRYNFMSRTASDKLGHMRYYCVQQAASLRVSASHVKTSDYERFLQLEYARGHARQSVLPWPRTSRNVGAPAA